MILLLPNKTSHDCSLIVNKLYSNRMNGKQVMLGWVKLSCGIYTPWKRLNLEVRIQHIFIKIL